MTRAFYPSRGKVAILPKIRGGETTTAEGIIYTEKDNQIYIEGKVASIGLPNIDSGGNEHLPSCNVGDVVYYDKHAGHGIQWDDKLYHVIRVHDIVLVE